MITMGIDIGGKNIKVLLLNDEKVVAREKAVGGFKQTEVAEDLIGEAAKSAGIEKKQIERIGVTGSGKNMLLLIILR